jgi:hypothetical protein
MNTKEIQRIVSYVYPKIQSYYGPGALTIPKVQYHHDIYARLSGEPEATGEHSKTTKAQYDSKTNTIWIYYPNMRNEEDVIRSIIHEYTHYTQDHKLLAKYKQIYSYDEDPNEIEAHKNEEDWEMFSIPND